jgi:hypothetical protein
MTEWVYPAFTLFGTLVYGLAVWLGYGRNLLIIGLVMLTVSVIVHVPPEPLSRLRNV